MEQDQQDALRLRRATVRALTGGLCVAAAVAVIALLSGSFDDTEGRIVLTSLAFSVFSATAAAGAGLRLQRKAQLLGAATVASAAAAFGLLLVAVWAFDDLGTEESWRAFGVAALVSLWTSHASLVVKAGRPTDASVVKALGALSIAGLGIDASVAVLALMEVLDDYPSEASGRILAAVLVLTLLATALPPLLRRTAGRQERTPAAPTVQDELTASVERLSAMDLPIGARVELVHLRELLRRA